MPANERQRHGKLQLGLIEREHGNGEKPLRVYVDTSVFGGVFDAEFEISSRIFLDRERMGHILAVVSSAVADELRDAPEHVRALYHELTAYIEVAEIDEDTFDLQEAYIKANIVADKWRADALHVAAATVAGCRAVVSWNLKHIVNLHHIPRYNGVNMAKGYAPIAIHAPMEVIAYDEDEEGL